MHLSLFPSRKGKWKSVIIVKLVQNVTYQHKSFILLCISRLKGLTSDEKGLTLNQPPGCASDKANSFRKVLFEQIPLPST